MTTPTTLDERRAKAKVKALSEGVRVALVETTDTTARYVAMSHTHPGIAYQVTLHIAEGSDECNCPAGAHGTPCKHLAASEMMYAAQLELYDAKHAREATEALAVDARLHEQLERSLENKVAELYR